MPRIKKVPLIVIHYESLSPELKNLYDKIYMSFSQKNITALREEAKKLHVESPTTLGKEDLIKRMTDKIIADYLPKDPSRPAPGHELNKNAELRIQGLLEDIDGVYRIGSVMVPTVLVTDLRLRPGDFIDGSVTEISGNKTLLVVTSVENDVPGKVRQYFNDMPATSRVSFAEIAGTKAETYIPNLQKGDRVMFGGMTEEIACDLLSSFVNPIGLFLGVAPESPVCYQHSSFIAPFDYSQRETVRIARLALERAKRLCEQGKDVVLVICGFDNLNDRDIERALFGSGRRFESGSMTVIADLNKYNAAFSKIATKVVDKINN